MKRSGFLLALTLAFSAIVLPACGGDGDAPTDSGATPPPGLIQEATRERDGIKLKLSVDKAKYGPGGAVKVKAEVENTNDTAVDYRAGAPQEPGFALTVVSGLAGEQPLGDPSGEQMSGTLAGGKKLSLDREWDLVLAIPQTGVTAPPGKYSINAKFFVAKPGFADLVEVAAAVTFEVEGTAYVLPPLDVVLTIVKNEEVKAWAAAGRGDNLVCASPARSLFYNSFFSAGTGAETFDIVYKAQIENQTPICGLAIDGDAWQAVLYGPKGDEPKRLTVRVFLSSPDVISVVAGGPAPAP